MLKYIFGQSFSTIMLFLLIIISKEITVPNYSIILIHIPQKVKVVLAKSTNLTNKKMDQVCPQSKVSRMHKVSTFVIVESRSEDCSDFKPYELDSTTTNALNASNINSRESHF